MERHGHLRVTQEIRDKLLKVSPATVDRLLQAERRMVDVTTGWLECMPLIKKSASDVIAGINVARKLIPFDVK